MFEGSDCLQLSAADDDDSTEMAIEPDEDTSSSENHSKKRKIKRDAYTQVQLQLAYEAVKNGSSVTSACKLYGVPRPTLQYRLKNNITDMVVRMGPKCVLNKSHELAMVDLLHSLADAGFTITHKLLKFFAADYVRANIRQFPGGNPFPAGIPGKSWVLHFLKRHPELANRMSENWAHYGYASFAPERVPVWFGCVTRYLEKAGLQTAIQNRQQVFTMDDVNLKRAKQDATFTCLFGANACGNLLPPLIIYPDAIKMPTQKKQSELIYAVVQRDTESTAGNALYQWLSKVFQPWLIERNILRPVILFVDGHRYQVGYSSSLFCQQHRIVLVTLLPGSDHTLRPLNVKLFESMKKLWHDEVQALSKEKFSSMDPLLKPVLEKLTDTEDIIRDGFYQSKMYPWNPEGHSADDSQLKPVIVPKVRKNAAKPPPRKAVDPMMALFRRMLESRLSEQQLAEFQDRRHEETWQGPVEHTSLFQIWRGLINEIDAAEPSGGDDSCDFSNMDTAQEGDGSYFEPEIVTVKVEDTGECPQDIKEEPNTDFEDL